MAKSKIGGQAVLEGVMMRGVSAAALAVRDEKKNIRIKTWRLKPKSIWYKIPVIRGVLSFFDSMTMGTSTLMASADVFGDDEEPTKFEKWVSKTLHIDLMNVVMTFSVVLGVALAVGLFIILPSFLSRLICKLANLSETSNGRVWIESGLKLIILFLYIYLTSLIKDIKRVYMYHGAEHKTINCFENELPLDVEHARTCKKFHNRCGTTFIFFVVLVGIVVFSLLKIILPEEIVGNELLRILIKIVCLPITAGLAYELLMVIAASELKIFYPLRLPGMLLQKITTIEPTDDMLEVAIASFKAVQELDNDPTLPTYDRLSFKYVIDIKRAANKEFDKNNVQVDADLDWMIVKVTGKTRSSIKDYDELTNEQFNEILELVKRRATGEPLAYILGDQDFYGNVIKCDKRALIPRPETEELVRHALEIIKDGDKVLDMCTGTGCIAISIAKNKNVEMTAVDIYNGALELAQENAKLNNVNITFVQSDVFSEIKEKYNVIVSNPPYIKTADIKNLQKEVKDFEPMVALDGGLDGMFVYRKISKTAHELLEDNGTILLEVGIGEAEDVAKLFEDKFDIKIIKDIEGIDRIVVGVKKCLKK